MSEDRSEIAITARRRKARQEAVHDWSRRVYGDEHAKSRRTLALRLLEEAFELAQTQGLDPFDEVVELARQRVASRKVGTTREEIGNVQVVVMCIAENAGLDVDACEAAEVARIHALPVDELRRKHQEKLDSGLI